MSPLASVLAGVRGERIALSDVSVSATLRDLLGEVTVCQSYRNDEDVNIEAVYTFPLPLDAVLNEGSKRILPLNESALGAVTTMIERADELGHKDPEHYLWCANQHHKFDPMKPGQKWDTAWRALRDAAGLRGLRFHDLRHTVVTRLLEAGEPDHVVESITGHLSRRMLEHYSHIRLSAKKAALDRLGRTGKAANAK